MAFTKSDHIRKQRPLSDKLGVMLWPNDTDQVAQLDPAKAMGCSYIRTILYINNDVLDAGGDPFEQYETAISECLKRGFSLIISFAGETVDDDDADTHSYFTKVRLATFKKIIVDFVTKHKGQNIIWEAFNEANGSFWSGAHHAGSDPDVVQAWTFFDRWLGETVKRIDPTSTYATLCSLAYCGQQRYRSYTELPTIQAAERQGLFDSNVDLVSYHPYINDYSNDGRPEILIRDGSQAGLSDKAMALPMIATEFGYSLNVTDPYNSWQGLWSERDAINYTLREIIILDYLGWPIISLYALGSYSAHNYRLLNTDNTLNAVGLAICNLTTVLKGYQLFEKIEVRTNPIDPIDDLYCFEYRKNNSLIFVYWAGIGTHTQMVNLNGEMIRITFDERPAYFKAVMR